MPVGGVAQDARFETLGEPVHRELGELPAWHRAIDRQLLLDHQAMTVRRFSQSVGGDQAGPVRQAIEGAPSANRRGTPRISTIDRLAARVLAEDRDALVGGEPILERAQVGERLAERDLDALRQRLVLDATKDRRDDADAELASWWSSRARPGSGEPAGGRCSRKPRLITVALPTRMHHTTTASPARERGAHVLEALDLDCGACRSRRSPRRRPHMSSMRAST